MGSLETMKDIEERVVGFRESIRYDIEMEGKMVRLPLWEGIVGGYLTHVLSHGRHSLVVNVCYLRVGPAVLTIKVHGYCYAFCDYLGYVYWILEANCFLLIAYNHHER